MIQRIGTRLLFLVVLLFGLAACVSPKVTIRWSTETEVDVMGFVVYRGPTANGPWEPVSPIILSEGDGVRGAEYTYTDEHPGDARYYVVEEIYVDGRRWRHPPIYVTPYSLPPAWSLLVLFVLVLTIGVILGMVLRRR